MLQKTHIKDFQSLRDVEIEHGGLTVITGASDLGKSAIIRAMKMLHRNNGTAAFVRHGKSKFIVEQVFNDNKVSIEKSKTTNAYRVDGMMLSKVGKDVPETVREVLKTDELVLDKDLSCDLNFSSQFDPPFLLTESSTLVTKVVSSLSGIEIIYSAIREGASQAQKLKATSQVLLGNAEVLSKYEVYNQELEGLQSEFVGLQFHDNQIEQAYKQLEKLSLIQQRQEILALKVIDTYQEEEALKSISVSLLGIKDAEKSIRALENIQFKASCLKLPDEIEVESLLGVSSKLVEILSVINDNQRVYNDLEEKRLKLFQGEGQIIKIMVQIVDLEKEEKELRSSIKICDKCGRPL